MKFPRVFLEAGGLVVEEVGMQATQPNSEVWITREQLHSRRAMPGGFAWNWLYRIKVPGEPQDFVGQGIGWARSCAKRHAMGRTVIETWKVSPEV